MFLALVLTRRYDSIELIPLLRFVHFSSEPPRNKYRELDLGDELAQPLADPPKATQRFAGLGRHLCYLEEELRWEALHAAPRPRGNCGGFGEALLRVNRTQRVPQLKSRRTFRTLNMYP